jgi:hypothetical protein
MTRREAVEVIKRGSRKHHISNPSFRMRRMMFMMAR